MRSAPARSAWATWSPNRAKSAARIEGAILMMFFRMFSHRVRSAKAPSPLRSAGALQSGTCNIRAGRFVLHVSGHELFPFRFDGGSLEDALNSCIQLRIVFRVGLLGRQAFDQRPREARDDAVVPAEPVVAFFARIAPR